MKHPQSEPVAYLFTHVQSGDLVVSIDPDFVRDERELWHKQPLYTVTPATSVGKDVNSTHTPAAWQVWVGADVPLNAPMGWQFYNTYDSLRSAQATARAINAAQQAPFAKVVPLYAAPPAAAWPT